MATPIATKDLGNNHITESPERLVIWSLTIDSKSEKIVVVYEIQTLSPNGSIIATSNPQSFERYNRPTQYYINGEIITPEITNEDGIIITPAVISDGTQVKLEANMKFNTLRNSQIGQAIANMIQLDVNDYPNLAQL